MENNFAAAFKNESRWTTTENGAVALSTTGEACLDFFSVIGALREADDHRIFRLYEEAYKESPIDATRILFYGRDIRGGLGERETFRKVIRYAADNHPESIRQNIALIGFFGRFDDLYSLIGTKCEGEMWDYMKSLFTADLELMEAGKPCSLLAKWIKTPDASSKNTRALGIKTAVKLGYSVYEFKRLLRKLRKHLDITEIKMSANRWAEIDYSSVPSNAMLKHRAAFWRHDAARLNAFVEALSNGETKINASTLYPYDLVEKIFNNMCAFYDDEIQDDAIVEAQWRALPNYIEPGTNAIVIADTSGSMSGRPLNSAIGLAIYFAERNTDAYHNLFMSFSDESTVHELKGLTLAQKIDSIDRRNWGWNTNLKAAFDHVLDIGVKNNIPAEEMVKSIIVISDMEIDQCGDKDWTFYDQMKALYESKGYQIPNIVFWNVNSRHDVYHADSTRKGVQLVSGQSASTFKNLVGFIGLTPIEMMRKVLDSDRYSLIEIAA